MARLLVCPHCSKAHINIPYERTCSACGFLVPEAMVTQEERQEARMWTVIVRCPNEGYNIELTELVGEDGVAKYWPSPMGGVPHDENRYRWLSEVEEITCRCRHEEWTGETVRPKQMGVAADGQVKVVETEPKGVYVWVHNTHRIGVLLQNTVQRTRYVPPSPMG